jgi:hypothetical protein
LAFRDHFSFSDIRARTIVEAAMKRFTAQHLSLSVDVPVTVKNLGGYAAYVQDGHFHVPASKQTMNHGIASSAGAPMGLFWWQYDSTGKVTRAWIEIHDALSAQDAETTFLAEAAHAIDMCSPQWSDAKRGLVFDAYHPGDAPVGPISWSYRGERSHGHGWFGPQPYFDTPGESFMVAVIRAFSEYPIADWWSHKTTAAVVDKTRELLGGGNVDIFRDRFLPELERSTLYAKWRRSNPGEAKRWDAFVAGGAEPAMVTPFGRMLVAAGLLARR